MRLREPEICKIRDNLVFVMPGFRHEFGDDIHHMSMVRTCEFDEYEAPIRGTGFSDRVFIVHEFLDLWIFYPIQGWLKKWIGDNELYHILRTVLGFFWGLNCCFPSRDVALYTVWYLRGCAPLEVFDRIDGRWIRREKVDGRWTKRKK